MTLPSFDKLMFVSIYFHNVHCAAGCALSYIPDHVPVCSAIISQRVAGKHAGTHIRHSRTT